MVKFVVQRDLPRGTENYSDRDLIKGDEVYRFDGHTYGCIGPGGVACSFDQGAGPFFEVAANALQIKEANDGR